MKAIIKYFVVFLALNSFPLYSQEPVAAQLYLLTCGPGTETYSVYGHSALRIVIPEKNTDLVYNWGIFDFEAPHFAWRFAKGRLMYWLGTSSYERFLREYAFEGRWVVSQKLNVNDDQVRKIFGLIAENLKPENLSYKYDFFFDNCSTRIRDLIEKSVGEDLIYPPEKDKKEQVTFRTLIGEYEKGFPWLQAGIDLLLGSPTDKKASVREMMFLPIELKDGLSKSFVRSEGRLIPLLTDPIAVVDFPSPVVKGNVVTSPFVVFSLLLIVVIILTAVLRNAKYNNIFDIVFYTVLSLLSILLVFFNFFADHPQTKWNLNLLWLSPFLIICLLDLIFRKENMLWFRIVFYLTTGFLIFLVVLPQRMNEAFYPVILIIMLRSSVRALFRWNPLTLPHLTEF